MHRWRLLPLLLLDGDRFRLISVIVLRLWPRKDSLANGFTSEHFYESTLVEYKIESR